MAEDPLEEYKYKEKLELKDLKPEFPEVFQKVYCPSCKEAVPATDLNINDKFGKCISCDVIFPFEKAVIQMLGGTSHAKSAHKEVLRPEGIDLFYFKDEMDITVHQPASSFDVLMAMPPLIAFLSIGIWYKSEKMPFFIPVIFLILSLYSIYYYLNLKKHKVHINIDEKELTIQWRPKKMNEDKRYAIQDIDQLYIQVANNGEGGMGVYMIVNGEDGQKHILLLSGLSSRSKAKYLEQEIERHLNITNKSVPEELS